MGLIQVFDKRTGELVPNPVPEHWLSNPTLGGNFSRTKPAAAAVKASTTTAKAEKKEN